uniref:WSC domain-containing protein 1-like n=1 Tax=Crassostrea virginica TaxID=6565 RepID=A0A8B8CX22_CRAVI|nr:WSC domain-containing protein 1-like [Crassostrea virginica]
MNRLCLICLTLCFSGIDSVHYIRYGCLENRVTRILKEKATYLKPNSPWHCQKFCEGYIYFGVEHGHACFCGNELILPIKRSSNCTKPCEGNHLLMCGGGYTIDVYRRSDRW